MIQTTEKVYNDITKYQVEKAMEDSNNKVSYSPSEIDEGYKQIALFNAYKKLFLLANYRLDMKIFKGCELSENSLLTYQRYVRRFIAGESGRRFEKVNVGLNKYLTKLVSQGYKPLSKVNSSVKLDNIDELLESDKLTKEERTFILEPITSKEVQITTVKSLDKKEKVAKTKRKYTKRIEKVVPQTMYCVVSNNEIKLTNADKSYINGYTKCLKDLGIDYYIAIIKKIGEQLG